MNPTSWLFSCTDMSWLAAAGSRSADSAFFELFFVCLFCFCEGGGGVTEENNNPAFDLDYKNWKAHFDFQF